MPRAPQTPKGDLPLVTHVAVEPFVSIVSEMKVTEPSTRAAFTPPEWLLDGAKAPQPFWTSQPYSKDGKFGGRIVLKPE